MMINQTLAISSLSEIHLSAQRVMLELAAVIFSAGLHPIMPSAFVSMLLLSFARCNDV